MKPLIVFCEDPLQPRMVDEFYRAEANAAANQRLASCVINFEALTHTNDPVRAVSRVPLQEQLTSAIYRGWMLTPTHYEGLYTALNEKGLRLINTPDAYRHCHYLPESYAIIAPYTPKSVWFPVSGGVNMDEVMSLLTPFDGQPIIVKDYAKSQKHYWNEACFIPSAADRDVVERVVYRFLELQDNTLNEGLVFREFVEFNPLTAHSQSGMPLTEEYRVFVLDGEPIIAAKYWEEGIYQTTAPDVEQFRQVMKAVKSRFYTIDIAKQKNGEWMIVELGDGQVAGLPNDVNTDRFYKAILSGIATMQN